MQLQLFHFETQHSLLEELFEAYFDCRKNKRNKNNSLAFEMNLEENLFLLYEELITSRYELSSSVAFIVNHPVKREIFAANFRDRVVHHLLINKINVHFEALFISNSFACRKGKGLHYGIQTINQFLQKETDNYSKNAWVMKLDVKGFFMHINKTKLLSSLIKFLEDKFTENEKSFLFPLLDQIVTHNPTEKCHIKGSRNEWKGLPLDKSLFHSPEDCGLPIGNLTSQIFANFYLHALDVYVTRELKIESYGRYVDDFILVHRSKSHLLKCLDLIRTFLIKDLDLTLHPKKIYLQEARKGVPFLGVFIKPNRIYCGSRIKSGFYNTILQANKKLDTVITEIEVSNFLCSMNSYLGMMKHFKTYRMRKKMIVKLLDARWWKYVALTGGVSKFIKHNNLTIRLQNT